MTSIRTLSQVITDIEEKTAGESVSIAQLLEIFHERGIGALLFIFALPMALPLPVPPGINVLLASPLLLLTGQQALGRHTLWLPNAMKGKTFKRASLLKMLNAARPWVTRLEYIIRPRLGFITRGYFSNLIGFSGLLFALTICVPIPMTNTVPSFAIALMAVGVLMRDGLAVLGGMIIGTLWICGLAFTALFVAEQGASIFSTM